MSTTRALERDEIHRVFQSISGRYAVRNRNMLICANLLPLSDSDLLLELQQRGYDIAPLLDERRQARPRVVTVDRLAAHQFKGAKVISIDVARAGV
jgi:hypothetical protein